MFRNLTILATAAIVVALPFLFRRPQPGIEASPDDPVLVVITPHNEAIRYEFARGFAEWHRARYGRPARIDWRALGGTTEIGRYLAAEFLNAARAWWTGQGKTWPAGAADSLLDSRFDPDRVPEGAGEEALRQARELGDLYREFRSTDNPSAFGAQIDLFFGGGEYDHTAAFGQGLTVPPWPPGKEPPGLLATSDGAVLIPERVAGDVWRSSTVYGCALSTFGICYNVDRLSDLGIASPPSRWDDLASPAYFRQLGAADPTKSGSIAKAFELIVHQKCYQAVRAAGFSDEDIDRNEKAFAAARTGPDELPAGVPAEYQRAVEAGWLDGIRLLQLIGANARYFTDSASKVPVDVGTGNAAAGIAIDFYARYEAEFARDSAGRERMVYVTPPGGSGVSCDPVSLLRGAPHRELAARFIEYALGEEGQKLWTYRPGSPGGPAKYALRRIPIRRSFYPSDHPALQRLHEEHARYAADRLADPGINPYELSAHFTYRRRWTGRHFGVHRDLIRAMCMDSFGELQAAWGAVINGGGPARQPAAMALLQSMPEAPEPLTWSSALRIEKERDRVDTMREWTRCFREHYARAEEAVR